MTTFYPESQGHIDLLADLWNLDANNKNGQISYPNSFTSNTSTLWNSPSANNAVLAESFTLNKVPSNNSLYSSGSDDLFPLDNYKYSGSPQTLTVKKEAPTPEPQPQVHHHHKNKKGLNTQLYKTELCDSFVTSGYCPYGNKCQFAHGENELKSIDRPSNWRSKPCANWAKYGSCRYGNRCCFKHGA